MSSNEPLLLTASDCGVIRYGLREIRRKQTKNLARLRAKFGAQLDPDHETELLERIARISALLERFNDL